MGLSAAARKAALDFLLTTGSGWTVEYSTNGTSVWAGLAATAVTWTAATTATPSVSTNAAAVLTATATAAGTVTHVRLSKTGLVISDWEPLAASRALQVGDRGEHAAGALQVQH